MTPKTSRRKNQKKYKHSKYRYCIACKDTPKMKRWGPSLRGSFEGVLVQTCYNCGVMFKRPWSGGGTGRRIPQSNGERGQARAGSNPAPTSPPKRKVVKCREEKIINKIIRDLLYGHVKEAAIIAKNAGKISSPVKNIMMVGSEGASMLIAPQPIFFLTIEISNAIIQ